MPSMKNLEDMPQLVLDKITSFLNVKQLLTLEQVSRKLKRAVGEHFSITHTLIIGYLPKLEYGIDYDKATTKDQKCLDGFLKIIMRCGIRLRIIYVLCRSPTVTTSIENYRIYLQHIFASAEISDNCPNIENIIAFPKMDFITTKDNDMFSQQNILLDIADTETYANRIKLKGETCKLRSMISQEENGMQDFCKRTLSLFLNLEQMSVGYDFNAEFAKFLPQFIKNGLKDLWIHGDISVRDLKTYCNIGKDLRLLRIAHVHFENDDDIAALNKLKLPTNLEFVIWTINSNFTQLSENVCNNICGWIRIGETDYNSMNKLKNLREFYISNSEEFKVIAEGSFPGLERITNETNLCEITEICEIRKHRSFCSCHTANTCDLQRFLPQLLINKGNQLIFIKLLIVCHKSVGEVWKALKHCKAAKVIEVAQIFVDLQSTVTFDDVKGICNLSNLELFTFKTIEERTTRKPWYMSWRKQKRGKDDACFMHLLHELVERAATEHSDIQFKYDKNEQKYSLYKIHT